MAATNTLCGYTPDLYPSVYDSEVDPDPRLLELEILVNRLTKERNYYGGHRHGCRQQDATGCECGWVVAKRGTLWDAVDAESQNLDEAIESHWD
jgi:hypothetical protein